MLKEDSAIAVQRGFDANRAADDSAVTKAYEAVSSSVGKTTVITIPNLRSKLQSHIEELLDAGENATAAGLKRMLDRHAPRPEESALSKLGFLDAKGNPLPSKVNNDITLSVEDAMALRKGVTNLFRRGENNTNRITESFKFDLDTAVSQSSLGGAGQQSVDLFRTATSTARGNFEKYRKGTTAEKATKLDADGNAAKTPTQRMDDLWNSGSIEKVRTFKEQFKGQPKMLDEIERSANSKIMEAIDAAMDNKASDFNSKMFTNTFLKWTPSFRIEVLGKEGAEALAKFERSVKLQGSTASKTGQHTNSGTAAALARRDLVDGAIKLVGKLGLAKMPLARTLLEGAAEGKQKLRVASNRTRVADDARRLLDGNLPAADVKRVQDQLVAELVRENPAWGQSGLANKIVRRWMASSATDDDKDKGERQASSAAR